MDLSSAQGDSNAMCGGKRERLSSGLVTFRGQTLIEGINTLLQAKTHIKPANQIQMNLVLSVNLHNCPQFTDKMTDLQEMIQLTLYSG